VIGHGAVSGAMFWNAGAQCNTIALAHRDVIMRRSTKRALIADTQELFSSAVQSLLELRLGFEQVIVVNRFEAATDLLSRDPAISIALIDIALPDMDGLASMASLRVAYPDLGLVVIAGSNRRDQILKALTIGLHGFLPRTLSIVDTVQAIGGILNGQIYVPPALSEMIDDVQNNAAHLPLGLHRMDDGSERRETSLTTRQLEVMQLISEGKTNKEIARRLGLAEGTVKAHVNAVFRILSVHNRASVAALLAEHQQDDI
jgi:DNA-binding NarL/FixJ family response regulator